jgi:hypothetical protein
MVETNRLENNLNSIEDVCTISHLQDVNTDLILSLCGKKIGGGCYRSVYDYNLDDKYVIKIEPNNTECNMVESMLWDEIRGLKGDLAWVKDWFAPVLWMSPNSKILVMEKTSEFPKNKKLERPREVPAFFTDLKKDNFGWIGNRFVCHDYGFIYKFIKYEKKMQKIKKDCWWD